MAVQAIEHGPYWRLRAQILLVLSDVERAPEGDAQRHSKAMWCLISRHQRSQIEEGSAYHHPPSRYNGYIRSRENREPKDAERTQKHSSDAGAESSWWAYRTVMRTSKKGMHHSAACRSRIGGTGGRCCGSACRRSGLVPRAAKGWP